jgi:hypothetical protein
MRNSLGPSLYRMNSIRINIDPQPRNSNKGSRPPINSPTRLEYERPDLYKININPNPRGPVRGIDRVGIILMGCWLLRTRLTSLPRVRPSLNLSGIQEFRTGLTSSRWTDFQFLLGKGQSEIFRVPAESTTAPSGKRQCERKGVQLG